MRVIVTTSVNPPTDAVELFDAMPGWHLVVVGDAKTPPDYRLRNGTYLSPRDQEAIDRRLSDAIGWNCIQRRNLGFVEAYRQGADIVATVDDDNVPFEGWGADVRIGKPTDTTQYRTRAVAFDPLGATNHPHLWHRGFPIQLVADRCYDDVTTATVVPDVQADLWDGDPDVDAVCRMQFRPECAFDGDRFPMSSTAVGPFNSQNTFIARRWLPHYFMFPGVGRMDDIWAAFHVQARGAKVVYCAASVRQVRNAHDLTADFEAEIAGYLHNERIVCALRDDPDALSGFVPARSWDAFRRYQKLLSEDASTPTGS